VIIDDFNFVCFPIAPDKTKPPLIVNADALLSLAIAMQSFEAIGRWRSQIAQLRCAIQLSQLAAGNAFNCLKAPDRLAAMMSLGFRAAERLDHKRQCIMCNV
jgi:hypothetical protein